MSSSNNACIVIVFFFIICTHFVVFGLCVLYCRITEHAWPDFSILVTLGYEEKWTWKHFEPSLLECITTDEF